MNITSTIAGMTDELSDCVGIKSGLGVTAKDVVQLLDRDLASSEESTWWYSPQNWLHDSPQIYIRVRAEDLESLVVRLLYAVGALPSPLNQMQLALTFAEEHPDIVESIPPDPDEDEFPLPVLPWNRFFWFVSAAHDVRGLPIELADFIKDFQRRSLVGILGNTDHLEWDGIVPLSSLFSTGDQRGHLGPDGLIDQRFIDYLHAQPDDLARMHWRQFELLVGRFFQHIGYEVEITPPARDGGIDVRAVREQGVLGPELVLIQAKRYAADRMVGVETVKALWSDLEEARATRAVIATTSVLAPGARAYCQARRYRLTAAERPAVESWLRELATHPRR